jgi:acyl-CoA thioesterase-1
MPKLPNAEYENLYIIGDSIAAGIGGQNEQTWPKVLQQKYDVKVLNLAIAGATVRSAARKQATKVNRENSIVLLEIGGNDILQSNGTQIFNEGLRSILEQITSKNRLIVMLELPVLPWQSNYLKIQRKLAKDFNVILVPRRFFVSILSEKSATLDGIHLSETGHELMADELWAILGGLFKEN